MPPPAKQVNTKPAATVQDGAADVPVAMPVGKPPASAKKQSAPQLYRPTQRPPIAVLTVFDDGKSSGENIRLRGDRFVIGRTEGDLLIPHDELISRRHIEITREREGNRHIWMVSDLQTKNGLFVRASRITLASGTEFLAGNGRYRFQTPESETPEQANFAATRSWGQNAPAVPEGTFLVEILASGSERPIPLTRTESWIGHDPTCAIRRAADPFIDPRHVRLFFDGKSWQANTNKTVNGLWLRVPRIAVEGGCVFQIGEQRFRLSTSGDKRPI